MAKKQKAVSYARERGAHNKDAPYAEKFAGFIRVIAHAKVAGCEIIIIARPWVIGDTYEEMNESLSHLAGTNIGLRIVAAGKVARYN